MIFRIIEDATGALVMSLDYPDPTIPAMYLKPGQSLYLARSIHEDEASLHADGSLVRLVDGRFERVHYGPLLAGATEPTGVGDEPVPIIFTQGGSIAQSEN